MTEYVLEARNLVRRFGAVLANDDLSFGVLPGELHAIIGPNGAGKTTFVAQLAGELKPTSGQIMLAGEDVTDLPVFERTRKGIARSFQITSLCADFSALENVMLAVLAQRGRAFNMWRRARNDTSLLNTAKAFLELVDLELRAGVPAGLLAHGEQRQLEVAVALACAPRVLLLDEPMAGMGQEESRRMIAMLRSLKKQYAIVLVEHDVDAVFALADRISVLVYGRNIATDVPGAIASNPEVRTSYLGERETANA